MKIGIILNQFLSLQDQLQQVVQAEQDGFEQCWALHFVQMGYDALTLLALTGQKTTRIQLGTSVIPIYPFHPLALASHALTTQIACGGRLTLGLGVSHKPVVENVMGLSYEQPPRRMRETLDILYALMQNASVDFSGEVFRVKANLRVQGASPIPIMLAALAPAMLKLAGEMTEGTITWMAGPKTLETHIVPRLQEAAGNAGRSPRRVCAALPVAVTDDMKDTRARAAQLFANYGQLQNYRRLLDREGVESPGDVAIIGNEEQVQEQLQALARIGVTEFAAIIFPATDDAPASTARTWALLKSLVGKV